DQRYATGRDLVGAQGRLSGGTLLAAAPGEGTTAGRLTAQASAGRWTGAYSRGAMITWLTISGGVTRCLRRCARGDASTASCWHRGRAMLPSPRWWMRHGALACLSRPPRVAIWTS